MLFTYWTTATVIVVVAVISQPSNAAADTFVYVGCSQSKFSPGSQYQTNVDSLLTSIANAASYSTFNKFSIGGAVHGLFQCRPDLSSSDCGSCVAHSVGQLGVLCSVSVGAAIQLDGCLVKYDSVAFFGVEDKTLVLRKCGPLLGYADSDAKARRSAVLDYLSGGGGQPFRVGGSGSVQGMAQCVGDLSGAQCKDCLGDAVARLKSECGAASWGDVFLGKCYARYSVSGTRRLEKSDAASPNDDQTEKTLAILVGLIAVVALLVIFVAFLRKICDQKGGK